MTDVPWQLVFDASNKPPDLWFALFGLMGVVMAAVFWQFRGRDPRAPGRATDKLPIFLAAFSLVWTAVAGGSVGVNYLRVQSALNGGTASLVEGTVEHFHPMPFTGHANETFDVSGVHFEYSDYGITAGFNNTSSHGGPIREGLYVRIAFIGPRTGATIVRLEIMPGQN